MNVALDAPPARKRPPGSGRKLGTPNKVNRDIRELIITKGKPAEFLCRVVGGKRIKRANGDCVLPTLADRLRAAELLLKRISPELAAVAVQVREVQSEEPTETMIETARGIAFMLRKAADDQKSLAKQVGAPSAANDEENAT